MTECHADGQPPESEHSLLEVVVTYVDGLIQRYYAHEWPCFRADGVDSVLIKGREFRDHSLYWLYREPNAWVVGCGSAYFSPTPPEVIFWDHGLVEDRPLKSTFPDLAHSAVKLGWWRHKDGDV